jgi:hypothetical protein
MKDSELAESPAHPADPSYRNALRRIKTEIAKNPVPSSMYVPGSGIVGVAVPSAPTVNA